MSDEEYPPMPVPAHVLERQALERLAQNNKELLDTKVTIKFQHLYDLMFGFQPEDEKTIDYVVVSQAFAIFLGTLDPNKLWITIEGTEVWRTRAWKVGYKYHIIKRKKAVEIAQTEGARHDLAAQVFKALRRSGMLVNQAERLASMASTNPEIAASIQKLTKL